MKISSLSLLVASAALTLGACSPAKPAAPKKTTMSMSELMTAGTAQKCTFTTTDPKAGQVTGTVYLSKGKMRGDYTATVSGKSMQSHMIVDGTVGYAWVDGMSTGMKLTLDATTHTTTTKSNSGMPDMKNKMDFSCDSWSEDDGQFTPPSNVTFSDALSGMMKAQGTAGAAGDKCAVCNSLSGAPQAQCKAALGCK